MGNIKYLKYDFQLQIYNFQLFICAYFLQQWASASIFTLATPRLFVNTEQTGEMSTKAAGTHFCWLHCDDVSRRSESEGTFQGEFSIKILRKTQIILPSKRLQCLKFSLLFKNSIFQTILIPSF